MTTTTKIALETWTPERQQEINESTPENPVQLTLDEERDLREAKPHILQMAVGAGRIRITIREGSKADQALKLKDKGMNNAAIAAALDIPESNVRRIVNWGR